MKNKDCKFELKTISTGCLKKIIKKLKSKHSSGTDGLSQKQLKSGVPTLAGPLHNIINKSISTGEFLNNWKEAIVTPALKKGDKTEFENYRPVSCLPAAAKLLELKFTFKHYLYKHAF